MFINTFSKSGKFSGTVHVLSFLEKLTYGFQQFVESGVKIRLYVAVDSTKISNKIDEKDHKLIDLYKQAITETVSTLLPFSHKQEFGFLGFGCKVNQKNMFKTFAFNSNENRPSVSSLE